MSQGETIKYVEAAPMEVRSPWEQLKQIFEEYEVSTPPMVIICTDGTLLSYLFWKPMAKRSASSRKRKLFKKRVSRR